MMQILRLLPGNMNELDHTDQTDQTDRTGQADQEPLCHALSGLDDEMGIR